MPLRSLLLLSLAACGAAHPSGNLATLANSLDPGESRPLLAEAPAQVRELLSSEAAVSAAGDVRSMLQHAIDGSNDADLSAQRLVMAVLILEGQSDERCDLRCLQLLEFVYRQLALVADTGFHGMFDWFGSWLAGLAEADDETEEAARYVEFLGQIFERAGERHDWAAARIFRETEDPSIRGAVLFGLGHRARSAENHESARAYYTVAVDLLGDEVQTHHIVSLSRECFRTLNDTCGEAVARRLGGREGDEVTTGLAMIDRDRRAARVVQANGGSGLEPGLARAQALYDLDRGREAKELYERLARQFDGDARPHVGLALSVFGDAGMSLLVTAEGRVATEAMATHLAAADGLANRDATYHGLRAMTWFFRVLQTAMHRATQMGDELGNEQPLVAPEVRERFAAELNALADDFSRSDPASAMAIRILGEVQLFALGASAGTSERGDNSMTPFAAEWLPRALQQLDETPDHVGLHRVTLTLALLSPEPETTRRVLGFARAEESRRALGRARLFFTQYFGDTQWLAQELSGDAETDALADLARAESPDQFRAVAARLEALYVGESTEARSRVLNNAAVALHRAGEASRAQADLDAALAAHSDEVVRFNRLAIRPSGEHDDAWRAALETLWHRAEATQTRYQVAEVLTRSGHADLVNLEEVRAEVANQRIPSSVAYSEGWETSYNWTQSDGIVWNSTVPLPWLFVHAD